jgi:hypothetical protein
MGVPWLDDGAYAAVYPDDEPSEERYTGFAPEAGEGDFEGSFRIRNDETNLCLEPQYPFEFPPLENAVETVDCDSWLWRGVDQRLQVSRQQTPLCDQTLKLLWSF